MEDVGLSYTDLHPQTEYTVTKNKETGLFAWFKSLLGYDTTYTTTSVTHKDSIDYSKAMEYLSIYNTKKEIEHEQKEKQRKRQQRKS